MSVLTAKRVVFLICSVSIVLLIAAAVCDDDPKTTSMQDVGFYVTFLVSMLGLATFAYFSFRCPQCRRRLSRPEIATMKCRECGCAFAESVDGFDSL